MMKTKLQPILRTAILLLAMLTNVISTLAHDFEVDGIYYLKNGTNATVTFKGANYDSYSNEYSGCVTIPTIVTYNGTTYTVTSIGNRAFYRCSELTNVSIPNSVVSIGSSAFAYCSGLSSVTIPNSVTSICEWAFADCTGLSNMTIPNSVTSIGKCAFERCTGLKSVTIPNSVTSIGEYAFMGCLNLISINIPNSVTSIGDMTFRDCSGLSSMTVESGNAIYDSRSNCNAIIKTSSNILIAGCKNTVIPNTVTTIGEWAFSGCRNLTSINIPNSVTTIGANAFDECSGLTGISIPNSVTFIGQYVFCDCSGLTSVNIPSSVTTINKGVFSGCSGLTSLSIPNSITSIGEYAYYGCYGLTSVTFGNSVSIIGDEAFVDCIGLTSITIPNSVTSVGSNAFSRCTSLEELNIDDGENQLNMNNNPFTDCPIRNLRLGRDLVYNDGSSPFQGMTSLHDVTIRNTVTALGKDAFKNCSDLFYLEIEGSTRQLTMPNNNNPFSGCPITLLSIGRNISYNGNYSPFRGMTSIRSLSIGNKVTTIGRYAFYGCSGFGDISIPNSVKTIEEYAFNGCNGVMEVIIGKSINSIGNYAFQGCTSVLFLTWNAKNCSSTGHLPADNVIQVEIGDEVEVLPSGFVSNSKITDITIPNSVTTINFGAFQYCGSMTDLTIGNAVAYIGEDAFRSCTSLTKVTIPSCVEQIDYSAFCYCTNLRELAIEDGSNQLTMSTSSHYIQIFEECPIETLYLGRDILYFGNSPFIYMTTLKKLTIGNSVSKIYDSAFYGCSSLSSITIPNAVTTIGSSAFKDCSSLIRVTFGNFVNTVGNSAFSGCTKLAAVSIPNSVTSIGSFAFYGCSSLTKATIGNSVSTIQEYTFYDCTSLSSVIIGNSVNSIKQSVFQGCKNLANVYCKSIMPPKYEPENYSYPLFEDIAYQNAVLYVPDLTCGYYIQSEPWKNFMVIKMEPYSEDGVDFNATVYPTSIRMDVGDQNEDCYFLFDNKQYHSLLVTGLEPTNIYSASFMSDDEKEIPLKFYTSELRMVPEGGKMLTATAAQLMAETNMADEETMCGFDWRRSDGPEDYLGTRAYCPVYDGKMAGTLKNLSKDTWYKFRPFYKSSAGNVYYGDWVTFYSGDWGVEFDPVVYTYNSPAVSETDATLQGVALRGSSEITEQGFEYWENGTSNVKKVTASGERMSATVSGLEKDTSYKFRAFVTSDGKTLRGSDVEFVTRSGEHHVDNSLDVNTDGVVNIADMNVVINVILSGNNDKKCDVNGDGVVNISDINTIISAILGN